MATENIVEQIQDTFLSCTICFQPFNRPKALPCLHTFCEECLRDYVASRFEGMGQFPCPLCRQVIYLPNGGVSFLPDNHFIVGLSDTVTTFSDHPTTTKETTPLIGKGDGNSSSSSRANLLIRRFGSFGTQSHEFLHISGIVTSPVTDDVFVLDSKLCKVAVFSASGVFGNSFRCNCSIRDLAITRAGTLLVTVRDAGQSILHEYTTDGRLLARFGTFYKHEDPVGLAMTSGDQPVISGLRQNCIHVLTQLRKPSTRFGSRGRGVNHFTLPYYLTTNSKDQIIVSDSGNCRIKTHRLDGSYIRQFGQQGSKPGDLFYPMGICVDKYDNIYVADANNFRVQVFSPNGQCLDIPVKNTFEYGIDVKPINVTFASGSVLLVVLRGAKFCQVHAYLCDTTKYGQNEDQQSEKLFCCC